MSIYLNNNSSVFTRPPSVLRAVSSYLKNIGVVPCGGSSNTLSKKATEIVSSTRNSVADLFSVDSSDIYFTPDIHNATEKIMAQILSAGDRVLMSAGDTRVIHGFSSRGIEVVKIPFNKKFGVKAAQIKRISGAKVVFFSHVNSITGATIPVSEIVKLTKASDKTIFILDISDSVGTQPINLKELGVDIVIFSTHKHLFGTGGVAGVYLNPDIQNRFPEFDRIFFEKEVNVTGIVSLGEGVRFIQMENEQRIWSHIKSLRTTLQGVLEMCKRVQIVVPNPAMASSILSFTIDKHMPNTVAGMLEERFGLIVGHGLCGNPNACKSLDLYPEGVLRVGLGYFNTISDVEYLGTSIDRISSK